MKRVLFFYFLIFALQAQAQMPLNGGFENGLQNWTSPGTASGINIRTGTAALAHTTSSVSNVAHTNSSLLPVQNGEYGIVIGWCIGSNAASTASAGGTLNGVTSSTVTNNIGTNLTRLTYASAQNVTGIMQNFSCRVNTRSTGGSTTIYWDDVIMYASSIPSPDLVKPVNPTGFTINGNNTNSISFSWTNGTDAGTGIQATIILRTTNINASQPVMNDQAIYSVGGGINGPNIVSSDWNVLSVSLGPATNSYNDGSVLPATMYRYAVLHRDLAWNYSSALVSAPILSGPALPVLFYSFSGSRIGLYNQLRWITSSEYNNLGFEVERSSNGNLFERIGFMSSHALLGTASEPLAYLFTDSFPLSTIQYYRLKQIDAGGHFSFSNILRLQTETSKLLRVDALFPDPVVKELNLLVNSPRLLKMRIEIINESGRVVMQKSVLLDPGANTVYLAVQALLPGPYIITLGNMDAAYRISKRFIKIQN